MKGISKPIACAMFVLLTGATAVAAEPPVMVNTSNLQPQVAMEVEKAAAQGMTSLKRYLESTRKIHGLTLEDVTRPADARSPGDITPPTKDYKQHAVDWKPAK